MTSLKTDFLYDCSEVQVGDEYDETFIHVILTHSAKILTFSSLRRHEL